MSFASGRLLSIRVFLESWSHRTASGLWCEGCKRLYSAASDPSGPANGRTVKAQLRLLYKLVHPDLFHNFPEARAVNERSFKLLQEYLDAATVRNGASPWAHKAYAFEFYLAKQAAGHAEETGSATRVRSTQGPGQGVVTQVRTNRQSHGGMHPWSDGGGSPVSDGPLHLGELQHVQVSLPPPAPLASASRQGSLPSATLASLGRLLSACGLPPATIGDLSKGGDDVQGASLRLSDLFKEAAEIIRQSETVRLGAAQLSTLVQHALWTGRGVKVSVKPPLAGAPAVTQAEVLQRLGRALDLVPGAQLAGHHLVLGSQYGMDAATGSVSLAAWDDAAMWGCHLAATDWSSAAEARRAAEVRQTREEMVALRMGVEMLFTDSRIGPRLEYKEFLGAVEGHAVSVGPVGSGRLREVPVRVVSLEEGVRGTNAYEVDVAMGFLTTPVDANPLEIWCFMEERGGEAVEARRRYRRREVRVREVKAHVRQKLRLRHLDCTEAVSPDHFLQCCAKLLRHAPALMPLTEGLSLCIGVEDRLPVEGGQPVMHLRWNFSMNEF